jgi:hypothetical protein
MRVAKRPPCFLRVFAAVAAGMALAGTFAVVLALDRRPRLLRVGAAESSMARIFEACARAFDGACPPPDAGTLTASSNEKPHGLIPSPPGLQVRVEPPAEAVQEQMHRQRQAGL